MVYLYPSKTDEKATSYRTRRSRDPWFDRLTTLSEVEGVSSKLSFYLDSGYPPAADSGMTDLMPTLKH
jgi:hypothetical protein